MKDTINLAYSLNVENIKERNDYSYFLFNNETYYFVPFIRDNEELEEIIACSKELKSKGIMCHDIIYNREGNIMTKYQGRSYILLKIIGSELEEYSVSDIVDINNRLVIAPNKSKLIRNNWGDLWSSKIDYFEYQISQIGKDKRIILDSFSYYIGLAEIAISYVNKTNNKR